MLALCLLLLACVVIGLCVGLLSRRDHSQQETSSNADPAQRPDASATYTSSAPQETSSVPPPSAYTLESCLSLYALAATSGPTSYPCGECTGILTQAPNDLSHESGSSGNATGVGSALQFCSLQSIFLNTQSAGGELNGEQKRASVLEGWMRDTNVCGGGWSGVYCDDGGRITTL